MRVLILANITAILVLILVGVLHGVFFDWLLGLRSRGGHFFGVRGLVVTERS